MQVTLVAPTERGGSRLGRAQRWPRRLVVTALSIAAFIGPVASAMAASTRASRTVFGGLTGQQWPVVVTVSPNGRTLTLATAALSLKCTSGGELVLPGQFARVPISAGGRFRAADYLAPTKESDGSTFGAAETLRGKLNHARTRVSGIWQLRASITPPSGQTDQCDSGIVRFHATQ